MRHHRRSSLTATSTTTFSSSATIFTIARTQDIIRSEIGTFGLANLVVGRLLSCNVSGLPSTTKADLPEPAYNRRPCRSLVKRSPAR